MSVRFVAYVVFALFAAALPAQTVIFDETSSVVSSPKKVGINLQSPAYFGGNELYKNLLWRNPGFEPNLYRQKLVASTANTGSTTTFIPQLFSAAPDLVTSNFWAGATFLLTRSLDSSQPKSAVCNGTISTNTAGTATAPPQYTFSSACSSAVQPGDIIVLRRQIPCSSGEVAAGNGGWWLLKTTNNSVRTDCAGPHSGTQSLILDASEAGSTSEIDALIDDTFQQTNGILLNGEFTISGYYKAVNGTNPTLSVTVDRQLPPGVQPGNPVHWPGNACRSTGNQIIGTFYAPVGWTAFSMVCDGSESNDLVPSLLKISFVATNGAVDLDDVSFYKSSGLDPTNTTVFRDEVVATLRAHCVGASLATDGVPCQLRDSAGQDADDIDNTILSQYQRSPLVAGFQYASGESNVSLEEFLELCKLIGAEPYYMLPESTRIDEAANWIEYLYGDSTTPYGAKRVGNGQVAPWGSVFSTIHLEMGNENWTPDQSFGGIDLLPDEPGTSPWAADDPLGIQNIEQYFDYSTDTAGIWNAMRASPYWPVTPGAVDLVLNFQEHGWSEVVALAMQRTGATSGELAAYTQNEVNTVDTLDDLWQPAMYEGIAKTTNPQTQFYQMVHNGAPYYGISRYGKVNIYEFDNGTSNYSSNLTQSVLDGFTVAAGYGTATALQALSNLSAGIVDQDFNGLSTYIGQPRPTVPNTTANLTAVSASGDIISFTANNSYSAGQTVCFSGLQQASFLNNRCEVVLAAGLSSSQFEIAYYTNDMSPANEVGSAMIQLFVHNQGAAIDMGGSTTIPGSTTGATLVRPQELALRLINGAIVGPMYRCSVSNPTSFLLNVQNQNGSDPNYQVGSLWTPPPTSNGNYQPIPQQYSFCFMNGNRRSMIVVNTDIDGSDQIQFSGTGAPSGNVIMTRYAPSNISQTNEAAANDLVIHQSPVIAIDEPVMLSSPSSDTLPPYSITRYDWTSAASTATTTSLTIDAGSAITAGSQITLTASVTGVPSVGTITFVDGDNQIGSDIPVDNGVATLTVAAVTGGTHDFTAIYSGGSGFSNSVSGDVTLTASPLATTTVLSVPSASILNGQPLTLSATISGNANGGTVTFLDSGVVIASSNVTGGISSCTVPALSAGLHSFTASYDGDSILQASVSPPVLIDGGVQLDISAQYTRYAIGNAGTPNGGSGVGITDYFGESFNAATLGSTVSYQGLTFAYGPVGQPDVTEGDYYGSIPAGAFGNVYIVGAAIYGSHQNIPFTVFYTDNTSSSYVLNLSEWTAPQSYAGETTLVSAPNQLNASGEVVNTPGYLYGYSLPLIPGKVVREIRTQPFGLFITFALGMGGVPLEASTSTAVTASSTSVNAGSSVNLSASVTGGSGSGTFNFVDLDTCQYNTTLMGSVHTLNGTANVTTNALTACTHYITATYIDDSAAIAPSSAQANVVAQ